MDKHSKRWGLAIALLGLLWAATALAAERFPWKFGMTPAEVASVTAFGPYKAFRNGDLETYKGVFNGKEENFQFFFGEQKKLSRIGIYVYEGQDLQAASKKWLELHGTIAKMFGPVETPGNTASADASSGDAFLAQAIRIVEDSGKTQMAPVNQPDDAHVVSSLMHGDIQGKDWYYVVIYFDAPK